MNWSNFNEPILPDGNEDFVNNFDYLDDIGMNNGLNSLITTFPSYNSLDFSISMANSLSLGANALSATVFVNDFSTTQNSQKKVSLDPPLSPSSSSSSSSSNDVPKPYNCPCLIECPMT